MKFMLMMNGGADMYAQYLDWPEDVRAANVAFMQALSARLRAAGELAATAALASPRQARRVRMGADGRPATDGVFPESKEFLAGFWIVEVPDAARAYAIAAEVSTAPAAEGKPLEVEVREVLGSHQELTR